MNTLWAEKETSESKKICPKKQIVNSMGRVLPIMIK
jgi:hypothetical protein